MKTKVENAMLDTAKRTAMILVASVLMAVNLKTFVRTGGLIPGGFTGLTRLIQEICELLWDFEPPFTVINLTLNAIPIVVSFKFIGKKFTMYSCLMIVVSGLITDMIPSYAVTTDMLLVSVFGGLFNAIAMIICLMAGATAGGTDFIAIFLSEKMDIDSWNYIFAGNVVILGIAGALFGWDKALYSIIFQFTSTQVLHALHRRYQKQTLLIVTKKPDEVYKVIKEMTNHDATLIKGEGCYMKQECNILYSVVGRDEVRKVLNRVRETDPAAFVNMIRTESLSGRFYQRPND
ncbi:YitT family protein [Acetatifactor aquisgranensis]|uniref:YitT family protein n=1 Tax=Acetatifactor aquisgranensis TaxID=2941233 RepID=UPI00203C2D35|nr:YitT family protein [Acetatifactor aquisgranensis]